jgi:superfamily II DNA or RNA helicase
MWPHQEFSFKEFLEQSKRFSKILLTIPTGGGKTRVAFAAIKHYVSMSKRATLYSNRKLLVSQISKNLEDSGIRHGVRASGYQDNRERSVQISSIQTEVQRVLKTKRWQLANSDLVIVDEAHLMGTGNSQTLLEMHAKSGAKVLGLTATPLDLGHLYEHLIVGGTNSQLVDCGALVPAHHYAPDEPDLKHIKNIKVGKDLTESQNVKAIMVKGVFGRVIKHWRKHNPDQRSTLLFAPGVKESVWFAEKFYKEGISSGHIDGEDVWINGKFYKSDQAAREALIDGSRSGEIKVVCNRFVLREGIDMPWLYCGIFACVFGSLQTYLQSGGRILRSHSSLDHVVIIDHGGNYHRHGSLNSNRNWSLEYTSEIVANMRDDQLRFKKCRRCGKKLSGPKCECGTINEVEPLKCPECDRVLNKPQCPCGWESSSHTKSRCVIQSDGTLKIMKGDVYRPRVVCKKSDSERIWESHYYRAKKRGATFRQAEALFAMENNWQYPSRDLPLMPRDLIDFNRRIVDVPRERLR